MRILVRYIILDKYICKEADWMKQHQSCLKKRTAIDRGKRRNTLNEVNTVKNTNKNPENFQWTSQCKKEMLYHIICKTMHMSNIIILNYRKIIPHREIGPLCYSSLSHMKQEYLESLIQEKILNQQN